MPVSPDFLVLGSEIVYALAEYMATASAVLPTGPYAYGKEIKSNQITEWPERQFNIRCNGGMRDPQEVMSVPQIVIEVRNITIKDAIPDVKWVVGLLHKEVPPIPGYRFRFTWTQHETFYREQQRRIMIPLYFSTIGQAW